MKRLVIGVLAHVDSGKTTLSEALLYACGAIKKTGRVDKGDTALDTDAIERDRGITVFSKQAMLNFGDTQISLIDTPGHVDFSTEMERTLQVLDYAVLLVNGVDGIQNHTQTLWKLLQEHNIPTFIFVNKLDLNTANKDKIYLELRQKFSSACVDFKSEEGSEGFFEKLAVCDDNLFENFVANHSLQISDIALAIKERKIFPCFFGSALKLIGTGEFLNELNKYTLGYEAKKDFGAKIFKISRDENGNRLTFMKITGGELKVKSLIEAREKNGKEWAEKPNQIRFYTGDKFIPVQQAFAGDVCAVTGLNYTFPGEGLGVEEDYSGSFSQPVFLYSVKPSSENSIHTILSSLRILEEEDPQLGISYDEPRGKINLQLMGKVQLEVLKSVLENRFNLKVSFDVGSIVYKETIENTVEGVGHFEPLRHYAEVHLLLQPLERGAGLVFDNSCAEEVLGKSWQRLIMTHLQEKTHKGVLTASPITDMKITLVAGKASVDHTEGGDFREATYRSVRQGLMRAKSILLEPWYEFLITVPTENIGRAMSDIQKMQGEFSMPTADGDSSVLQGRAPVSLLADYYQEITNYTKGKGRISLTLGGYFPCHNTDDVVAEFHYDSEGDLENTPDSVFCSHGAGFTVKWYEIEQYMHVKSVLKYKNVQNIQTTQPPNRAQAIEYAASLEQDAELLKIFEQTYGKIQRDVYSALNTQNDRAKKGIMNSQNQLSYQSEYLLVDAYNIIFAWEDLNLIAKENIDAARSRLINIMCNYQGFKKCNVIVVFDAYKLKGNLGSVEQYHNISIVYTKEAETADMYIEKVTHQLAKNYRVRVATSDGLEQMIILGHGALRLSASAFKEEVTLVEKAIREYLTN